MFLQNKYHKWYFDIIKNAQERQSVEGYSEVHHIVPRCMGGKDAKSNLVTLTAREHFIAHCLLARMTEGHYKYKLHNAVNAFFKMSKYGNRYTNSRLYETSRRYSSICSSMQMKQMHADGMVTKDRYVKSGKTQSHLLWMTDGTNNKRVRSDVVGLVNEYLADGWVYGRNRNYITDEYRQNMKMRTTTIWQRRSA